MKKTIIGLVVIAVVGVGVYYLTQSSSTTTTKNDTDTNVPVGGDTTGGNTNTGGTVATNTNPSVSGNKESEAIGKSVEGSDITAYHYGTGSKEVLFVGGIHGGYEWNSALVAYQLMDYLKANPTIIPSNVKVTVIPVLNPDGLAKVVGKTGRFTVADVPVSQTLQVAGRFNASGVDLNRNFDCDWQSSAMWQDTTVSGGDVVFSEPESSAMRDYITAHPISGAVVWYSAAGGVYSSNCHAGVLPATSKLTSFYAAASGYPPYVSFDYYKTTGDMVNWMAKNKIPAISVLLTNHTDVEWDKNLAGVKAVLNNFAE
ncbi:MAG TPA: M14 family metallopeptidase [Candidatus Paceibacterota bacterium]